MDVLDNIDNLIDDLEESAEEFEQKAADAILREAKSIVPVDTGKLKRSGNVKDGSVVFGVPYALEVHENPNSEGHKFLERARQQANLEEIAKDEMSVD